MLVQMLDSFGSLGLMRSNIYYGEMLLLAKVSGLEGEEELLTIVPPTVRSPFTGS